jgi:ATP-binding cassette, subfamily B, multidrug efflux pump
VASFSGLFPYLRRYRRAYAVGIAAVAVTAGLSLLAPWVLQAAVDDLGRGVTSARLGAYAGALLALALVGGAARFLMRRVIIGASRDIEADVRTDFFAHLARLPLAFFDRRRTGDLMSRAMNDLEAVRLTIGISILDAFNTVIVFVVAVILMLGIDVRLTLVALLPLPFVSVSVKYFGAAIYRRSRAVQAQLAELTSVTQESLAAVRLVRAFGQESGQADRFADALRLYFRSNRGLIRLQSFFYATMAFCLGVGAMLVLWKGSGDVVRGRMTLGQFVAFGAYQAMLGAPMVAFGSLTNTIQRGIASWRRLVEVLEVPAVDAAGSTAPSALRGVVEVRHLSFAYDPSGPPVVRDVSFEAVPGMVVALVGTTGSGKSTILRLLPRLYEPPRGTVFVDGIDVRDLPLDTLRSAIGFVSQEPFLFADTLVENIALGGRRSDRRKDSGPYSGRREIAARAPEHDRLAGGVDLAGTGTRHVAPDLAEAVRHAAAIARLDADLQDLPAGYDTPLGERGANLSGGQRQRAALARALLVEPVILVLDDPLSAVDAHTEEAILDRLRGEMRKRTSLIVSNRVSTVRDADLILVFDAGRVVERGRHADLVGRGGVYADLYRKQLLTDALAAS